MTNGKEPVSFISKQEGLDRGIIPSTGLTKRELMAIEFTKAFIIGTLSQPVRSGRTRDDLSAAALRQADSLIKALNETP